MHRRTLLQTFGGLLTLPVLTTCSRAKPAPAQSVAPPPFVPVSSLCGAKRAAAIANAVPLALRADTLPSFVDPLPIPEVLRPAGTRADPQHPERQLPYYRVPMRLGSARLHRDLPPTRVFTYAGTFPGPTIEARAGEPLLIEWSNELPEKHLLPIDHSLHGAHDDQPEVRAVVHVHGARVPPESDGYPERWLTPGQTLTCRYPNQQEAATLWYHDHAMGIERLNHYAGMFGAFLLRDSIEDALQLPSGQYEIPLLVCDRMLDRDAQLYYPTSGAADSPWVPEVYGDAMLVNGKLQPYLEVEPRPYRFRIINAANARFFYLSLSNGAPLQQIGSDQGLLAATVALSTLTLAPAERADVIVDFSAHAGEHLTLQSQTFQLLQFRVAERAQGEIKPVPTRLRPLLRLSPARSARARNLSLNEYEDPKTHRMLMLLNGSYWRQPVSEVARLNSIEIWNLVNLTEDTHPIHLHLVRFQVLERRPFDADEFQTSGAMNFLGAPVPPDANERGWKDTVRAEASMVTSIIVRFEGFAGRYVWHCHVLEHAANEMMRPFDVIVGRS